MAEASNIVIAIFTVILVFVTGYYAWQNKKMVEEMKLARKSQFIPSLKIKPTYLSLGSSFDIEISNIGLGPAKNIRGKIRLEPKGDSVSIFYPLLYPQERFALRMPFNNTKTYEDAKKFDKLILQVQFKDIINETSNQEDVFVLKELEEIKNDDYREDRISTKLGDIDYKLSSIKDSIDKIPSAINQSKFNRNSFDVGRYHTF